MRYFYVLLFYTLTCSAYDAKHITNADLKQLEVMENSLHVEATKEHHYTITEVSHYVFAHLSYKVDFTLLRVEAVASARAVQQSANQIQTADTSKYYAGVTLTYPIFDEKEKNAMKQQTVAVKQKIIDDTEKFYKLRADFEDLKTQKAILKMIETREKSRKLSGVDNFDAWLKSIQDLQKVNASLTSTEVQLNQAQETLISYVEPNAQAQLEKMLK